MAHTCPYCGSYCTCKGDWDDIDIGYEPRGGCVHHLTEGCEGEDLDDEDDYPEGWPFDEPDYDLDRKNEKNI